MWLSLRALANGCSAWPDARGLALLVGVLAFCVATASRAQDTERAASNLEQGKAALMREDAPAARRHFEAGLRGRASRPQRWLLRLGLALALELDGDLLGAARAYRAFLSDSADDEPGRQPVWLRRRERAHRDLARLDERLLQTRALLHVQSDPSGAKVALNGIVTDHRTPAAIYVDPGTHRVVLELDAHEPEPLLVVVDAGQRPLVHRKLVQRPLAPVAPAAPTPSPEAMPEPGPPWFAIGVVAIGAGAGAAIIGGALHWTALRDAEEVRGLSRVPSNVPRDRQLRDRIESYQIAYGVSYALGGALAAAGVTMLLYDALGDDAVSAWLAPTPDGVTAGLRLRL